MDITTIVIVLLVAFAAYLIISHDSFASAIKAKLIFWRKQGADAVDSVDARITAAEAAQDDTVRKGRKSLYDIQTELNASQIEIDRVNQEIKKDQTAIAMAHQNNDRDTFGVLVEELNSDKRYLDQLLAAHQEILNELDALELAVDEERKAAKALKTRGKVMIAKARVATVVTAVNEAKAGLTDNGAGAHMAEAQKILDQQLSRANASKAAAQGLTPGERAKNKADQYLEQAENTQSDVSADDLWNQMSGGGTPASA